MAPIRILYKVVEAWSLKLMTDPFSWWQIKCGNTPDYGGCAPCDLG